MLIFALILIIFALTNEINSINLTYILKKSGRGLIEPSCIAEEDERYKAIGWVYPMPQNKDLIADITTKYIPNIQNDYNCKFSKNDNCNLRWKIRNWQVDEKSLRTYSFISDNRWEDFPTIYTSGSETFDIEIPSIFKIAFSVRSSGPVEFFLCNGWNLKNYPCYYFNIDKLKIYLKKYTSVPQIIPNDTSSINSYEAFSRIISDDEWRNFIISLDVNGKIELTDVNLNRTAIEYIDKDPLNPIYLILRSKVASLWKLHQNEFFYTKINNTYRFGPQISLPSKDLCISLYVSTCESCEMTFYMQDDHRTLLQHVQPTKEGEWALVKLKHENVVSDKTVIIVETKFKDKTNESEGFWAVDDIRVCNENEVKVTYLKLNETLNQKQIENISCQVVKHPNWRPKKLLYDKIEGFPEIRHNANTTSIRMEWTEEDPKHQLNYFISYQANDICEREPYNLERVKSNGFLMTKYNEIVIDNLIPYTNYNITFSSVLHENDKHLKINTLETDLPSLREIPTNIKIQSTSNSVFVSWEYQCQVTLGHLVYSLEVFNRELNFSAIKDFQTESEYTFEGLEPFTHYSLTILTARNTNSLKEKANLRSITYNFTTLPGSAPAVKNLEIYAIGKDYASLRFDLPKNLNGKPSGIQVSKCNTLSIYKCKSVEQTIEKCKLWSEKYCVYITSLMEYQQYKFDVRLKNYNTPKYGEPVSVSGYAMEKDPGMPSNITYKVVDCQETTDYCSLNVSWAHPYFENGTITTFELVLNSTTKNHGDEEKKTIHEIYKVLHRNYLPRYNYQIKYIPYSTNYTIYIRSANVMRKSKPTQIAVQTDNLGDHIDQSPKILGKSDTTVVIKLPEVDPRLLEYTVLIVVQDDDETKKIDENKFDEIVLENLCESFGDTWISHNITVKKNESRTVTIGHTDEKDKNYAIENKELKSETKYCLTFVVTNNYRNTTHEVIYNESFRTANSSSNQPPDEPSHNHLYVLLLLLLLIPLGYFAYRYMKKRRMRKNNTIENAENVYESLPFEDTLCASNFTYDHLLHK